MPELIRQSLVIIISLGLIAYSLARLTGVPVVLLQLHGFTNNEKFSAAVEKLNTSLPEMNARAFVPMSPTVYLGYSLVMGLVLFAGAVLVLLGQNTIGLTLIFGYCLLFGLGFINYRILNAKIAHLAVSLVVAVILAVLVLV